MTAIGAAALNLFELEFDTFEISQRMNLPENVVAEAIYQEREKRKQQKEETTKCQQPQEQLESS